MAGGKVPLTSECESESLSKLQLDASIVNTRHPAFLRPWGKRSKLFMFALRLFPSEGTSAPSYHPITHRCNLTLCYQSYGGESAGQSKQDVRVTQQGLVMDS